MTFDGLAVNLERVRDRIASVQAAEGVGQTVDVVAVTKGHPAPAVDAARQAGLADVGENRVQEAVGKMEQTAAAVRWHLIGHLQTNKAKLVPGRFALVHSVDSIRVAEALSRAVERVGPAQPVLVQVNVAGEAQKSGCAVAEAPDLIAACRGMAGLELRGLMTMAPFTDDTAVQRRVFAGLRAVRDAAATAESPLAVLSMGMSGDYEAAVAEGATLLRLGTVLFGERRG